MSQSPGPDSLQGLIQNWYEVNCIFIDLLDKNRRSVKIMQITAFKLLLRLTSVSLELLQKFYSPFFYEVLLKFQTCGRFNKY